EGQSFQLTTGIVNGVTNFFIGGTNITSQLTAGGGELAGYLTARDVDIPNTLSSLDQLAFGIATQVNALNNAGTDLPGDNGGAGDIFSEPTGAAGRGVAMSGVVSDANHF